MKPNYIGIVGAIIAFVSIALPWWSMTLSTSALGISYSGSVSIYPYQATVSAVGFSASLSLNLWYGWVALLLIIVGGILGIAGSLLTKGRILIFGGGLLALLSIAIFAVGLQSDLSQPLATGFPQAGLFSSGTYTLGLGSVDYSTYLSYGFWLALAAAIIMLVAMRYPKLTAQAPSAPPPTPAT